MGDNVEEEKRRPFIEPFLLFAGGCSALTSRLVVHPRECRFRMRVVWQISIVGLQWTPFECEYKHPLLTNLCRLLCVVWLVHRSCQSFMPVSQ